MVKKPQQSKIISDKSILFCVADIRIRSNTSSFGGLVQVLYNGEWGGICDDFWGEEETTVVCRMFHPG